MRHDNHPTLKLLDRLGERIDRLHIQMVSRLVEQEDMRVFHGELGEDDTGGGRGGYR